MRTVSVGRWIDAQDDEGLSKLVGAKFNTTGALIRDDSACLVGHIRGYDETGTCLYPVPGDMGVGLRFDDLCERFGTARIGHLISERASRVLEERKRESLTLRTCEHCGATVSADHVLYCPKVPVSVHVSLNCEPVEVGT